jgi:DNA polymerase-3 subunit epsilon
MTEYRSEVFGIEADFLRDIVVFDLETTGLDPYYDEIIEIAAIRILDGEIAADQHFHTLVKPKRAIPLDVTLITGISNRTVRNAPQVVCALREFSDFCGNSLLVAHYGHRFDMKFLEAACRRRTKGLREVDYIDSMHLSWLLWGRRCGKSHSLDSVISRFKISRTKHRRHRALGDAHLTAQCVTKLLSCLQKERKGHKIKVYKGIIPT